MSRKPLSTLAYAGALTAILGAALYTQRHNIIIYTPDPVEQVSGLSIPRSVDYFQPQGFAGHFLASQFAQSEYDWTAASFHLDRVLAHDPGNQDLIRRAMILAMGAGDLEKAAAHAETLFAHDDTNSLAILIMAVTHLSQNRLDDALAALGKMPQGDITAFVRPVLEGWVHAAQGSLKTEGLNGSGLHSYSGALMALHLGQKDRAEKLAARMTASPQGISPSEAERLGDIYVALKNYETARALYKGASAHRNGDALLTEKIEALDAESYDALALLSPALQIKTPVEGAALALLDMAQILYQEESDSSAKLFAQMALALNPTSNEARLLMANALARNGRYEDAIAFFADIRPGHPSYLDVQRHIADLIEKSGDRAAALQHLENLFVTHNDIDSLIRIGDLHRQDEQFDAALDAYNRAAAEIGTDVIPEEYWYLLYARGMTYEREGLWTEAERDLKAAIVYRPDHPYLLNYLAYGWADQGIHLNEAVKLLQRASSLRPHDGYITDSLGWTLFMMGRYTDSLPHLEKAVTLMPYDATLNDHLGDAYWMNGRYLEARYQWQRAINHADSSVSIDDIRQKLVQGYQPAQSVQQAQTRTTPSAQ